MQNPRYGVPPLHQLKLFRVFVVPSCTLNVLKVTTAATGSRTVVTAFPMTGPERVQIQCAMTLAPSNHRERCAGPYRSNLGSSPPFEKVRLLLSLDRDYSGREGSGTVCGASVGNISSRRLARSSSVPVLYTSSPRSSRSSSSKVRGFSSRFSRQSRSP